LAVAQIEVARFLSQGWKNGLEVTIAATVVVVVAGKRETYVDPQHLDRRSERAENEAVQQSDIRGCRTPATLGLCESLEGVFF
jgi:hypothetical protein